MKLSTLLALLAAVFAGVVLAFHGNWNAVIAWACSAIAWLIVGLNEGIDRDRIELIKVLAEDNERLCNAIHRHLDGGAA